LGRGSGKGSKKKGKRVVVQLREETTVAKKIAGVTMGYRKVPNIEGRPFGDPRVSGRQKMLVGACWPKRVIQGYGNGNTRGVR